jgi:hypothetical protein
MTSQERLEQLRADLRTLTEEGLENSPAAFAIQRELRTLGRPGDADGGAGREPEAPEASPNDLLRDAWNERKRRWR